MGGGGQAVSTLDQRLHQNQFGERAINAFTMLLWYQMDKHTKLRGLQQPFRDHDYLLQSRQNSRGA